MSTISIINYSEVNANITEQYLGIELNRDIDFQKIIYNPDSTAEEIESQIELGLKKDASVIIFDPYHFLMKDHPEDTSNTTLDEKGFKHLLDYLQTKNTQLIARSHFTVRDLMIPFEERGIPYIDLVEAEQLTEKVKEYLP